MAVIYFDRQQKQIVFALVTVLSAFICGILIGHFGINKPAVEENHRDAKSITDESSRRNKSIAVSRTSANVVQHYSQK